MKAKKEGRARPGPEGPGLDVRRTSIDIRTFGAVMTTFVKAALNCGQVRGPVQLGFARSVEPVVPQEVTITRVAITTEADAEKKGTEMGRKYIVPYGLYRCEGYVSANLARKATGFSEEDLSLLWEAILNMFEHDHSAARGKMAVRELIVFKHDSELGCAPAWKLFETVRVARRDPDDRRPRPLLSGLCRHGGRGRPARRRHLSAHGVTYHGGGLPPPLRPAALRLLPPPVGPDPPGAAVAGEPAHHRRGSVPPQGPRRASSGSAGGTP